MTYIFIYKRNVINNVGMMDTFGFWLCRNVIASAILMAILSLTCQVRSGRERK
jgi:hypothetical protein